ncbi:MAG: two-component regulator propeller domain-containing protein [Anaerolineaceae bacterium]|nr:two-component regulator propeller domain-containing protein [Anaerolineaceae bacterium]
MADLFNEDLNKICQGESVSQREDLAEEYQQALQMAYLLKEIHFYKGIAPTNAARINLIERARRELPRRPYQTQIIKISYLGLKIIALTGVLVLLFFGFNKSISNLSPKGTGILNVIPINSGPTPSIIPSPTTITLSTPLAGQATPAPGQTTPGLFSSPTSITYLLPTTYHIKTYEPPTSEILVSKTSGGGALTTYFSPDWWNKQHKEQTVAISAIAAAKDGSVWFGTMGGPASIGTGVYHFDGKTWMHYTTRNGLPWNEVSAIVVAPDDSVWFSTTCCGVSRFDGKNWSYFTSENGLASNDVRSSAVGEDGSLWFGTDNAGVSRFDGKSWKTYSTQDGLWGTYIGHIAVLLDGSLLFSSSTGSTARLDRFDQKNWSDFKTPWESTGGYTEDISVASDGTLWFATELNGVYRYKENTWSHYALQDGLASNSCYAITAASDSILWLGTDQGLSQFDGGKWKTFTTLQGLSSNWISSLVQTPDGSIWIGSAGGISRYKP